jgi:glucose/arabinose dehydrogenase
VKIGLSVASPRFVLVAVLVPLIVSGTGAQQIAGAPITIAWDANQERVAGYRVHVGTRTGTYTESFDVGRETTFTYDATQPGLRYYFAVSAYLDTGVSSARSTEISTVAVSALPAATSSAPPPSAAVVSADRTSTSTQAMEASSDDLRVRARGLDSVTSLSATSDGTLFLVEREQRVGVIPSEASVAVMSLAASAGTRITGVVPDPLFTSTRLVYVGLVQDAPTQGFSVVRYRLVRNALGEPAVVISGLPTFGRSPRLAIDSSGMIYVAVPGAGESTSDPYAGMILRFNADGTVPQGSRAASPQLAHGADDPAALTADGSYLWFVGHQSAERDRPDGCR